MRGGTASSRTAVRAPVAGAVAALVMVGSACSASPPSALSFVRITGRLPAISGSTLDGATVAPARFAGRVVVANFWNYDCPPCRLEQPLLEAASEHLPGDRVAFVGLMFVGGSPAWPDDAGAARVYLRRFDVTYPTLIDGGSRLARAFGVVGIPTTVVADARGRLRFKVIGQLHRGQVEALVRMALQEPEAS